MSEACEECWGDRPVEEWAECAGRAGEPPIPASAADAYEAAVPVGFGLCSCPCHRRGRER
jgi:hypothetical protein